MHDEHAQLIERNMHAAMQSGSLQGLHGLVVSRYGRVVLEVYFAGLDQRIGHAPGPVRFGPEVLHDLRSVTKSVVSLLCGIVLTENEIDVGCPLSQLLPRWRDHFNAATSALTLQHVLTMTMGLAWDESMSYADARNSEIQMALSPDRVAYVLSRPAAEPAGERWHYCGGATELLAALIQERTGKPLASFALERLFDPLGLSRVEWNGDGNGPYAASGLRMTPRDLARIGELILQRGRWQGRALVPESWLEAALRPQVRIEGSFGYGYHFYSGGLEAQQQSMQFYAAMGNGGQRLYVVPALDASVAISAGHYNDWKLSRELPGLVLREYVLPLLTAQPLTSQARSS
jgi:CubicO group peptidase (beta-lactamase class C family)